MNRLKSSLINKVLIDPETECWNFTGCVQSNGYARLTYQRQTMGAHRWSYIAFVGDITAGMDVCHKCDNRKCINPSHLFLGTRKDNMVDAKIKGRTARGLQLPQSKLSESDKQEIIELVKTGLHYKDIAPLYGVTRHSIGCVAIKAGIRRKQKK